MGLPDIAEGAPTAALLYGELFNTGNGIRESSAGDDESRAMLPHDDERFFAGIM